MPLYHSGLNLSVALLSTRDYESAKDEHSGYFSRQHTLVHAHIATNTAYSFPLTLT